MKPTTDTPMQSHNSRNEETTASGGRKNMSEKSQLPISQYIETVADNKEHDGHPAVARKARFCAKNISKFDSKTPIGNISRQWLDNYFTWLTTIGATKNTAANYAKIIRLAYRDAVTRDIIAPQPQLFTGIFTGDAKSQRAAKTNQTETTEYTFPRWYCLKCRRKTTNTALRETILQQPGIIDTFAPQVNEIHIRPDGSREIRPMAILSTLLFFRTIPDNVDNIVRSAAHQANIVRHCGSSIPAPISDYEMHMFHLVVTNGTQGLSYIAPDQAAISPGDRVVVTAGMFQGLEGYASTPSDGNTHITVIIQGICAIATPKIPCEFIKIISKA